MFYLSSRTANGLFTVFLLAGICTSFACSLPNLEKPECSQARDHVKQFYSWHLGTDADERELHPEMTRKFVSPFFSTDSRDWERDQYTLSTNVPKSFRIGKCEVIEPDKVKLQVQLLWRDDNTSRQTDVTVSAIRSGDVWQIAKVTN